MILHVILHIGTPSVSINNTQKNIKRNCLNYYDNLLNLLKGKANIISLVAIMGLVGSKQQVYFYWLSQQQYENLPINIHIIPFF